MIHLYDESKLVRNLTIYILKPRSSHQKLKETSSQQKVTVIRNTKKMRVCLKGK